MVSCGKSVDTNEVLHVDVFVSARPDFCLEQLLVQLHCLPGTQVCA